MASSSKSKMLNLPLSPAQLAEINAHLRGLTPEEILAWGIDHLPGLYQTTAFGLTGLVAIDMLDKIASTSPSSSAPSSREHSPVPIMLELPSLSASSPRSQPPLIFLDTLYHFQETYELVEEVKARYPDVPLYVYKPADCETVADFETKWGARLWERDENVYDFAVKVEPARRAYQELGVKSVITGRRATQGGDRAGLQPLEVDETGLLKLNPLFEWTFPFIEWYTNEYDVPRNRLLSQGYRSVGDWHSTSKPGEGQGERSGRWAGREKTECGLHKNYYDMLEQAEKVKNEAKSESILSTPTVSVSA
ncbi:PAPS-reduct domain-containing protein [Mycena indigotica]|uniref:PAPS-reduct domain-containing protein n=1 Tax=Mycena indigotica TaxID=2126181 RepID=A0A8H6SNC5_9AGAR|nr:PAPS-reduct domain-containing protein [Mycena indigotica]KAF7302198.1 PAPS-reduct domain-containing protein [Mycena indigotica]